MVVELKVSWQIDCISALQIQELARILLDQESQSQVRHFSSLRVGSVLQRVQKLNII